MSTPVVNSLRGDLMLIRSMEGNRNTGQKHGTPCIAFSVPEGATGTLPADV